MSAIYTAIAILLLSLTETSRANGWISSGGELFSDAQNPWFLHNTTRVEYCIDMDHANFGQSEDVARQKIKSALAYWQEEFRRASFLRGNEKADHVTLQLATQQFVEVRCRDGIDLKFQLGVLTEEQQQHLRFPNKTIGVAVRTEYDKRHLRGKGFIYVSPESGRYALSEGAVSRGRIVKQRWQYAEGKLLELVLIHELGHIFGLQHLDHILMRVSSPGDFISDQKAHLFASDVSIPKFFLDKSLPHIFEAEMDARTMDFFYAPSDASILKFKPTNSPDRIEVFSENSRGRKTHLGDMKKFYESRKAVDYNSHVISIYITPDQIVFDETVHKNGDLFVFKIPTIYIFNFVFDYKDKTVSMVYDAKSDVVETHLIEIGRSIELHMKGRYSLRSQDFYY